jgi:hypothetical protein
MEWSARAAVDDQGWQARARGVDISLFVLAAAQLPRYTRREWSVAVECSWHSRIA